MGVNTIYSDTNNFLSFQTFTRRTFMRIQTFQERENDYTPFNGYDMKCIELNIRSQSRRIFFQIFQKRKTIMACMLKQFNRSVTLNTSIKPYHASSPLTRSICFPDVPCQRLKRISNVIPSTRQPLIDFFTFIDVIHLKCCLKVSAASSQKALKKNRLRF